MPSIEVSETLFETIETWVDEDFGPTVEDVIEDAMIRKAATYNYKTESIEGVFTLFASADSWAQQMVGFNEAARGSLMEEYRRIRSLRLGERISQMEELDRSVKAHIEILAQGMLRANRPWWRKLLG